MGYSAKVVLRRPARKDGTCQVRLLVVLDGRPVPVGLKVNWPPALFDESAGRCLASMPLKDRQPDYAEQLARAAAAAGGAAALAQLAKDYNLIIGQSQSKANDIIANTHYKKDMTILITRKI
jgi:hypothetical protein